MRGAGIKRVWFYLSRFLLGFAITGSIFYVFFASPEQKAEQAIKNYREEVKSSLLALQKSFDRISGLADPAVIKPQEPRQAWSYAISANDALDSFQTKVPKTPKFIRNTSQNDNIKNFNQIIGEPDYQKILDLTSWTLKSNQALLDHHAAVMKSLINVLQYDPKIDLASSDSNILNQHLEAAKQGLKVTADRLDQAPDYNDTSLGALKSIVQTLQEKRDMLAKELNNKGELGDSQKYRFYIDIESAQHELLQNRLDWWKEHQVTVLGLTDEVEKKLARYVTRLEALYN